MAKYVTLYNYRSAIAGGGPERFKEVQKIVAAEQGEIHAVYGLLGAYDIVAIGEFPTPEAAMKAAAKISNLIGASSQTMPAVELEDFLRIVSEV